MTLYNTDQYNEAMQRVLALQDPRRQPLSIAHTWELSDLMTACAKYEYEHDKKKLAMLEAQADISYMNGVFPSDSWPCESEAELQNMHAIESMPWTNS